MLSYALTPSSSWVRTSRGDVKDLYRLLLQSHVARWVGFWPARNSRWRFYPTLVYSVPSSKRGSTRTVPINYLTISPRLRPVMLFYFLLLTRVFSPKLKFIASYWFMVKTVRLPHFYSFYSFFFSRVRKKPKRGSRVSPCFILVDRGDGTCTNFLRRVFLFLFAFLSSPQKV